MKGWQWLTMKITNHSNLPDPIYRAILNDEYTPGDSDITVSQLSKPPRVVALEKKHWSELEDDASNRLWMLFGTIAHGILEKANVMGLVEQRLFTEILGWKVSGKFDHFDYSGTKILDDYKMCSVWQAINHAKGESREWEYQANAYAFLLREAGYEVKALRIQALLRDWRRSEMKRSPDYPRKNSLTVDLPMWNHEDARAWITERVKLHQAAQKQLPLCSKEDRWQRADVWAIMKKGRKSAVSLKYSEEDAINSLTHLDASHYIEVRKGEPVRCASEEYCLVGKNGFCSQWNEEKSAVQIIEEAEVDK